ncbi:MAG: diguanylate cyclase domain-containing protein, partial [Microcystaceae cyanobacterium]
MNVKTPQKPEIATILVVDDEPFMQMQIRLYLQKEGYQIFGANNGQEALKIYDNYQPDLVLLDALMPIMDGFECCRRLTENPEKPSSPILMITGLEDERSVDLAFEAGASDYITKPIHWAVLRQRVKRLLHQIQLQRQLEAANQQLQKLALLDGLTKINNRRAFDLYLEQEWKHGVREQQPLALILADVDYFKCYNDFYGHPAGDVCLQKIAELLRDSITRATDFVARYGGEEFAVILPNTSQEGAVSVAQRILTNLRHLAIPQIGSAIKSNTTNGLSISDVCLAGATDYV